MYASDCECTASRCNWIGVLEQAAQSRRALATDLARLDAATSFQIDPLLC